MSFPPTIQLDDAYFQRFSDTEPVALAPYDPALGELAQRYATPLRRIVGSEPEIEHRGATAFQIIGRGESDLYVRVEASQFAPMLSTLRGALGCPSSPETHRARFSDWIDGVEVEVMLVDKSYPEEIAGRMFFEYLRSHPEAIREYAETKLQFAPISRRAYYRQKYLFVRSILQRAQEDLCPQAPH